VDAVYAWDQPDLHLYFPAGADLYDRPASFFQETLIWGGAASGISVGAGADGWPLGWAAAETDGAAGFSRGIWVFG
jgi:hypothetical protein